MERRRKNRKTSAASEEPRCVVHDVPDDLLRLILLRLDSPLWLLRAACACKRWRRIVVTDDGGRAFLRLASSLHPPAVVGHYHNLVSGGRRFVPSSLAPAPIDGGRFSLDFISSPAPLSIESWEVAACHGGLVLLRKKHGYLSHSDIVVCDPLTHRYKWIHQLPGRWSSPAAYYLAEIFLIDGDNGNTSISNFRLLYMSDDDDARVSQLYMLSMSDDGGGGNWRLLRQWSQSDEPHRESTWRVAGLANESLFLGSHAGTVTLLDSAMLEFSKVDLPIDLEQSDQHYIGSTFAVVHSAASSPDPASLSPPVICIVHVRGQKLELFRQVCGRGGEWVLEHTIPKLSSATRGLPGYPDERWVQWLAVEVIAGGPGFAVLLVWLSAEGMAWQLSFNVDTLELQAATNEAAAFAYRGTMMTSTFAYPLPWPQSLRACPS